MNKILQINRSIPGGGKSTLSRRLVQVASLAGVEAKVHSTDDKYMVDGVYKYDISKLRQNHLLNFQEASVSMANQVPLVIIDNTNRKVSDYREYCKVAKGLGYIISEVIFFPGKVEDHFNRQAHGVPLAVLTKMIAEFQPVVSKWADIHFYVNPEEGGPDSVRVHQICMDIVDKILGK